MQLLDQTGGDIQIFCSSLGTTGSMIGISRALKDRIPGIACVGVARKPNNPVPGPRTLGLLRMIDFDWKSAVLAVEQAGTAESFQKSMELYRAGLAAGPSSGMALAGLLKYLRRAKAKNALDGLRNKKGEINCVFLGCDTPFLYLDEYFKYLPRSHFPKIKNEGLLPFEISFAPEKKEKNITIKPARMLKEVFKMTPARLWRAASAGALPKTDDFVIADMRDEKSFDCGKIPNSVRVPEEDLAGNLQKYSREWENKKVIFVCNLGEISFYMAKLYDGCGISARSLSEGFMRYSELDYPRVSDSCAIVPSGQRQRR
jgi:rhodanese-related sulfurtransferase